MNVPEFTVAEFSRSLKRVVEDSFGYVRIKGEITGFKRAGSGHLYFSLKEDDAILAAVCFKNSADTIAFEMADGLQIIASGRITTFAGRSNYQIVVEKVEISGIGAILEMIEKRRQKLAAEGLFDVEHKKLLPFFPRIIGVITSETGAVIQDILHRVEARCPTRIKLYPSAVQGKDALRNIVAGIKYFNKLKNEERPDIVIIARGGGSFEDLLVFNDEELVRAVFASDIAIISAVGHETDTTLIDFVSDLRAPTPTAAAELATPVLSELKNQLEYCAQKLKSEQEQFFSEQKKWLENVQKYLIDPAKIVARMAEKFQALQEKLQFLTRNIFDKKQQKLNSLTISSQLILFKINFVEQKIIHASELLKSGAERFVKNHLTALENLGKLLKLGHYQEILKRGFSLIKNQKGQLIASIADVKIKEEITVEMNDGEFQSYVLSFKKSARGKVVKAEESQQPRLI